MARDGKSYPRRWERDLDPRQRPDRPAAVRTYDRSGQTTCVAFDLDCKKAAGRGAVLRDTERLAAWLAEAGCAYLVDESPSGGRHVYVLLDHPRAFNEISELARNLRGSGALKSLDPSPLVNLTEGCIRPPGAEHRLGGHQRLITPWSTALRATTHRTTSAAWAAFVLQLPAPRRLETDLLAPSRDRTQGQLVQRPLDRAYLGIALTGTFDAARYPSTSEARAAVLLHALCRGWTPQEITTQVTQGSWPGLARLFETSYGHRYAGKALAGDLLRAQSRAEEVPFRQIHASAKRPRAGSGKAARLYLRQWTTAFRLALEDGRWSNSLATEQLLVALGDAARRSQSVYTEFGCRHLSMCAGMTLDHSTTAKLLRRLAGEDDPFVLLVESDRGVDADMYEIRIPDQYLERLPPDDDLPEPPYGIHPVFALFDRPVYRLYTVLERLDRPVSPTELAQHAHVAVSTVYKHVPAMRDARIITRRRDGTVSARGSKSLTSHAKRNNIAGRLAAAVMKWRAERNSLRIAHGLPEIHHGRRDPRVAWPGQGPRPRPAPVADTTAIARPTTPPDQQPVDPDAVRQAQERAIGGGLPDWREDLEEATAVELLRNRLGAQLIAAEQAEA